MDSAKSVFDDGNDGADRCSAFIASLMEIMKEHRVKVSGKFADLQHSAFEHEDGENGWILDMQNVQMLTDGNQR